MGTPGVTEQGPMPSDDLSDTHHATKEALMADTFTPGEKGPVTETAPSGEVVTGRLFITAKEIPQNSMEVPTAPTVPLDSVQEETSSMALAHVAEETVSSGYETVLSSVKDDAAGVLQDH